MTVGFTLGLGERRVRGSTTLMALEDGGRRMLPNFAGYARSATPASTALDRRLQVKDVLKSGCLTGNQNICRRLIM